MAIIDAARIMRLLTAYEPFLAFDPAERIFPASAEEFLDHQGRESWAASPSHQRGTAVLLAPSSAMTFAAADVAAGSDDPSGGPIKLDATVPNGIGQLFAYDPTKQELFLDCGGWDDAAGNVDPGAVPYTKGSADYLARLFAGFAEALHPSILGTPAKP